MLACRWLLISVFLVVNLGLSLDLSLEEASDLDQHLGLMYLFYDVCQASFLCVLKNAGLTE